MSSPKLLLLCPIVASMLAATHLPSASARPEHGHLVTAEYYVAVTGKDSNRCTASAPCQTINNVDSRLGKELPLGTKQTIVHVAPGKYTIICMRCAGAIITQKSGTTASRIRYISEQRWGAKIVTVGSSSSWNNRASFVDIVGFDISGGGQFGIENNSSLFSRMLGNHVHHIHSDGTCSPGAGIMLADTTSDEDVIGNWVDNVGDMNVKCYQVHGVYAAGPRARIINNITDRNMGWGIHLWHAAAEIVVANNTSFANGQGGIIVGCGDQGCVTDDNTVVMNNLLMDNNGYGIIEQGTTGIHNSYSNNLSYHNKRGDLSLQHSLPCRHCVYSDPQLVNYKADGSGDYHLKNGSSAISAGMNTALLPIDFDGGARPANGVWSIGAFQYGAKPGIWPWY